MNTDLMVVGLLGAACTLLAPILALYLQHRRENKYYVRLSRVPMAASLEGQWVGRARVRDDMPDRFYKAALVLKKGWKRLSGHMTVTVDDPSTGTTRSWTLLCNGGFVRDRFVKLDYFAAENAILHFGTIIFELSPNGKTLRGKQVFFGRDRQKLGYGEVELEKQ